LEVEPEVSPSSAQSIFEEAIDTIGGLLQLGLCPTVVNDEIAVAKGKGQVTAHRKNSHGNGRELKSAPEVIKRTL
jgi:hypothetical protein